MAIDIYTGPLTRYYLGLWENQLQQTCRENGREYQRVSPDSEKEPNLDAEYISDLIVNWKKELSKILGCQEWNEGKDFEYYTTQFHESSEVHALSCYIAASKTLDSFPRKIDILKDPIIKDVAKKGIFIGLSEIDFYIPSTLPNNDIFQISLPNEREVICSSTHRLTEELELLTDKIWGVSVSYLDSLPEEIVYKKYANNSNSLTTAIFGLCKLHNHALFSKANNVPIILDY